MASLSAQERKAEELIKDSASAPGNTFTCQLFINKPMSSTDTDSGMSQFSVVILGGGIAGLTLGRCLRQKGISSIIYDRASSAPRHTYGITLESWAYRPFLKVIDMDEHDFRRQLAVDSLHHAGVGKVEAGNDTSKDENGKTAFRACLSKFESMLREGQNIKHEHSLSSASLPGDGGNVELTFENGIKVQPSFVIDATGIHSRLRRSLLEECSPTILPYAVYNGKRYIDSDLFQSTFAPALGDGNKVVRLPKRPGEPRLEVSINEHLSDGRTSISHVYSRPARFESTPDPLHNPDRPNTDATKIPEEFYEELKAFIEKQNLDPIFHNTFDPEQIREERLLHWLMRTVLVPETDLLHLLKSGIVMIGDSVHATPILGGRGANVAISDAVQLAEVIAESKNDKGAIEKYYRDRWKMWKSELNESNKRIAEMHSAPTTNL